MKRAAKQAIEALRSGAYTQCTDFLTLKTKEQGECDCCLGVISKICPKSPAASWAKIPQGEVLEYGRDKNSTTLTEVAQAWVGFRTDTGTFSYADLRDKNPLLAKQIDMVLSNNGMRHPERRKMLSLAELNDFKVPFMDIASVIESEPEGLFK